MTEHWSDWIPWTGGECPIPWAKAGEYELRFNSGAEIAPRSLSALAWDDADEPPYGCSWWREEESGSAITAYRFRLDAAPKGD